MATTIQQIHPVAHLPLVLGVLRRLEVATVIDHLIPPHPAHGLSCGRGVEAVVLAILDGHHALSKVGRRLEERGMLALLQPGLTRAALNDYRLGVTDCNRNQPGLQSAHCQDHIYCIYRPAQDHIICN